MPDDLDEDLNPDDEDLDDEPDEPDEAELDEDLDDELADVVIDDDDDDDVVVIIDEEEDEDTKLDSAARKRPGTKTEADEEDEADPDDVEADLGEILRDRIAASDDLEEEEDDEDDANDAPRRVTPLAESEFVCQSCYLVKKSTQRVAPDTDLCLDCV